MARRTRSPRISSQYCRLACTMRMSTFSSRIQRTKRCLFMHGGSHFLLECRNLGIQTGFHDRGVCFHRHPILPFSPILNQANSSGLHGGDEL
jgi:hypothetical protein